MRNCLTELFFRPELSGCNNKVINMVVLMQGSTVHVNTREI